MGSADEKAGPRLSVLLSQRPLSWLAVSAPSGLCNEQPATHARAQSTKAATERLETRHIEAIVLLRGLTVNVRVRRS